MSKVPNGYKNIESQMGMLNNLAIANKKMRNNIIKNADPKLIKSICECCLNTLHGRVKLDPDHLNKLRKYRSTFRALSNKSSIKAKKILLQQKGGFLPVLLPSVIAGLSTIISSIIARQ